jgi:hypothetical protein
MYKLSIFVLFSFWGGAHALITHVTTFEADKTNFRQLVIVCGDHHQLGSWEDNVIQFIGLAQLVEKSKLRTLFLVENLSSPNEHFNRPQDLAILQEKESYIFGNLSKNYYTARPVEMPTVLHFWGCTQQFFTKFAAFLRLSASTATKLASLPVINVDNRHRNVYYGESLIGWSFGPYDHAKVREIQETESSKLTLPDLLAPQLTLKKYFNSSTGWLRSIFDEILDRQEFGRKILLQNLLSAFDIRDTTLATTPLARLAGGRQQEFYRYLQKSPLENILREMVEANALWHITQRTADIVIVLAGTNHTGHTEGNWAHQTPGLVRYLDWLGYKQTFHSSPTRVDLLKNKIEVALKLRSEVPNRLSQLVAKFNAEKSLRSMHDAH